MRRRPVNFQVIPVWVYLWLIVFALIMLLSLMDPTGNGATLVKLCGVGLCVLFVARTFPRDYLLLIAMFATSIADIILANNNVEPIGIIIFLVIQLLHLTRLSGRRNQSAALIRKTRLKIFLLGLVAATVITLDYIFQIVPVLFVVVFFYGVTLILNVITSFKWRRAEPKNPQATMALAGFLLFFCCDFCTVISYCSSPDVAIAPEFLYTHANFFVWLFYYPSQVLIANTGKLVEKTNFRAQSTTKHRKV